MNSAYAAGDAWEFGQMRRLQAGREALLERIRTSADRPMMSWSGSRGRGPT